MSDTLSKEEQKRLEEVLLSRREPEAYAIYFDLYTGLRLGELAALAVSDIDLDRKELYVGNKLRRIYFADEDDHRVVMNEAKVQRVIPLPDHLAETMRRYVEDIRKPYAERREQCKKFLSTIMPEVDFLFLNIKGNPLNKKQLQLYLDKILNEVGVAGNRIEFFALREAFRRRYVEYGYDLEPLYRPGS